jgi:hypothetical protein
MMLYLVVSRTYKANVARQQSIQPFRNLRLGEESNHIQISPIKVARQRRPFPFVFGFLYQTPANAKSHYIITRRVDIE